MARRKRLTPLMGAAPEVKSALRSSPSTGPNSGPNIGPSTGPSTGRAPIAAVAGDAAAEAALAEVSREMETARAEGRLAEALPLEAIRVDHLARDRVAPTTGTGPGTGPGTGTGTGMGRGPGEETDEEMAALVESLRSRGQQTPIEVIDLGPARAPTRYGLISGWRRLTALKRLHAETGAARFATVLAVLRSPADAAEAYVSMVEENEIRVGLSHYERARIAAQAVSRGAFPTEKAALLSLYASASRAKRSKIRSFLGIVAALDGALAFPAALPERLGLALAKRLEEAPEVGPEIAQALAAASPATAEAEQALIQAVLTGPRPAPDPAPAPASDPLPDMDPETDPETAIQLQEGPGRVTLSGPGVTAAFRRDLAAWLAARHPDPD